MIVNSKNVCLIYLTSDYRDAKQCYSQYLWGSDLHCKVATQTCHHPGECVNILKSYCKVCYLVECLGHSAFILKFYIAFDIILICLLVIVSLTRLS